MHRKVKMNCLKFAIGGNLLVIVVLCASCGPSPGYRAFVDNTPRFYAQLAVECDGLLPRGRVTEAAETHKLARDTNSLPPLIRALNPDSILIDTNLVLLRIGTGVFSFGIVWRQSDDDADLWVLSAYTEGSRREVYARKRSTDRKRVTRMRQTIAWLLPIWQKHSRPGDTTARHFQEACQPVRPARSSTQTGSNGNGCPTTPERNCL